MSAKGIDQLNRYGVSGSVYESRVSMKALRNFERLFEVCNMQYHVCGYA